MAKYRFVVRKKKGPQIISNLMIIAGILLIAAYGVYEAVQFPWRTLFVQWDLAEMPLELPDPAPLSHAIQMGSNDIPSLEIETTLPENVPIIQARPVVNLVQLGTIKIPRIMISENIVEGSHDEMLYGVGHVRGTAMPGKKGNCVLSAHRGYVFMRPFRYLDKMEPGDLVYVTDSENRYTYQVFKIFIITPEDTWVLYPQEEEEYLLTLLTCTPYMTYTHRLIVWCSLVDTRPLV